MHARDGWRRLGDEVYVYEQAGAQWGCSNAGLICDGGTALLVDTLLDRRATQRMLDAAGPLLSRRTLAAAVNTGPDAPHHLGNGVLAPVVPVIASRNAASAISEVDLRRYESIRARSGTVGRYIDAMIGRAADGGRRGHEPTVIFDDRFRLGVGTLDVDIVRVCQAGQSIVHVPEASVVFAGEVCRSDGFPSPWLGSLMERLRACERILDLRPVIVVPGHGPAIGRLAVEDTVDYLRTVVEVCRPVLLNGGGVVDAVNALGFDRFASWPNPEWRVAHVAALHRDLGLAGPWTKVQVLQAVATAWSDQTGQRWSSQFGQVRPASTG